MKKSSSIIAVTIILFFLIFGCNPSMVLNVKRPAEVNLKEYKKVAMGSIDPGGFRANKAKNIEELLTSKLFETGNFEVLDRQNIDKILKEQKFGHSGIVDENTAAELGKIIGSAVIVFGHIQKDNYKEETSKGKPYTNKEGKTFVTYSRSGEYSLEISLRMVDVMTGKVLAVKTIPTVKRASTSATNEQAPPIDPEKLYERCLQDITTIFTRMVAPYDVQIRVSFEKDAKLPELEQALVQIKIGEWDTGMQLLKDAASKNGLEPKIAAKAKYNFGILTLYDGDHDAAIELFKQAMQLNPKSKKYQDAILNARNEKAQAEKLKQQL